MYVDNPFEKHNDNNPPPPFKEYCYEYKKFNFFGEKLEFRAKGAKLCLCRITVLSRIDTFPIIFCQVRMWLYIQSQLFCVVYEKKIHSALLDSSFY